jgi:multicomponent Na+:H+ antiporter subunit E
MLPGFTAWFMWHSMRGGVDVARRALAPQMRLHPGFLRYRLRLPPGHARLFLTNCISLLPGTLSADIEGNELVLHALDTGANVIAETREAERRVGELFGMRGGFSHE